MLPTGNDNFDKAQARSSRRLQGPSRIIAELSMAKLDRAVYSQRQLEAVMEDFWFNHFNVFAEQGRGPLAAHLLRARHDPPAHHGQISGSAGRHGQKSGDALLSRQLAERRSRAFEQHAARKSPCAARAIRASSADAAGPPPGMSAVRRRSSAPKQAGPRPERKLRPRSDGAAHRRRRCRLHAAGRDRNGQVPHRLDRPRAAPRSGILLQDPNSTRRARKS